MSAASISCSAETRDWVKAYMRRHGLPTYDDALRHMKAALEGQDHDGVARAAAPQAPHDAEQPAKKQKLAQLISWASFEEHDEILTYLTVLARLSESGSCRGWKRRYVFVLWCHLVFSACSGGSNWLTNIHSSPSLMSDQRNGVDPTLGGAKWMHWIVR